MLWGEMAERTNIVRAMSTEFSPSLLDSGSSVMSHTNALHLASGRDYILYKLSRKRRFASAPYCHYYCVSIITCDWERVGHLYIIQNW